MNQSLNNLALKVEKFSDILLDKGFGQIQQVTSSPHLLCMQCRVPGQTIYLYFGRGVIYQGFDFGTNKVPTFLRIQDRFLQFARKNWRGMQVQAAGVSEKDRVFYMEGKIGPYKQKVYFFWRGRDLFFINIRREAQKTELFTSWEGKQVVDNSIADDLNPETLFSSLGFGEVEFGQQRAKDFSFEDYLALFSGDQTTINKVGRDEKTLAKMRQELSRFDVLNITEKFKEKNLEEMNSVGEGRFKVSFKGLEGHFKKREHLFDKIKAWRRSKAKLEERIAIFELKLTESAKTNDNSRKKLKIVQPIWKVTKDRTEIKKLSDHIEFTYKTWRCFLGRTAHENDFIRKEKAKKEDWWLHLEGLKSGHLIVKTDGFTPTPEDLIILGSALVDLCGQEYSDIPLIYTQVKNLKGVKGIPGSVTFKKERHMKVVFNPDWRQNLTSIE